MQKPAWDDFRMNKKKIIQTVYDWYDGQTAITQSPKHSQTPAMNLVLN